MYALVDCNNFYASCEQVFDPTLHNRPILILSNNDGCIISRSREAKALGFPMGGPIFKYTPLVKKHNVAVLSSNYALYGDMSRRVMEVLRRFAPECEIYSIDESFLHWSTPPTSLDSYGAHIRDTIAQCTGLAVSVGFGLTKTLAKTANHLAKKNHGVIHLPPEDHTTMQTIPASTLWGIGPRSAQKLAQHNIHTAYDLQQANDQHIRNIMSVCGQRTLLELRGIPCIELEKKHPRKKIICCSRSFGKMLTTKQDLREALATFTTRAAEKLRADDSVCRCIQVQIETNGHRKDLDQYIKATSITLPLATAYTPLLVTVALEGLEDIFCKGYQYKRAEILLTDISPQGAVQQDLFSTDKERPKHTQLMKALDHINHQFGSNTIASAALGTAQAHKMNQQQLTPRYTTRWTDLINVKC